MIITVAGTPGSGKSTVAKLLCERLGFRREYAGGMQRSIAKKRGLTIEEYNEYCERHKEADEEIERYIEELGKSQESMLVESRTAALIIPRAVKLFFEVDIDEAARRIMSDKDLVKRNENLTATVEQKAEDIRERMANERRRYKAHYGFDIYDKDKYDLVIDTTHLSPEQVVSRVFEYLKKRGLLPIDK